MWQNLLEQFSEILPQHPPAPVEEVEALERSLDITLPDQIRGLLLESNGIDGEYTRILWNTTWIQQQNHEMRNTPYFDELYMPFDHLLFFGDLGNGDFIGYRILKGKVDTLNVYRWDHESDSRICLLVDLEQYISQSLAGKIFEHGN